MSRISAPARVFEGWAVVDDGGKVVDVAFPGTDEDVPSARVFLACRRRADAETLRLFDHVEPVEIRIVPRKAKGKRKAKR